MVVVTARGAEGAPEADGRGKRKKRRPYRRDQILQIAVALFHERGYHATGMDDIGEAAGITGPAIYRHFKNKEEIITAAITEGTDQILAKVQEIVETSSSPEETLERLARNFMRATLNNPALAGIIVGELRLLDPIPRAAVERVFRLHLEEWVHALSMLRPELSDGELRVLVAGAFGLFESVTQYESGLDRQVVEDLLVGMAMDGLLGARPKRASRSGATRGAAKAVKAAKTAKTGSSRKLRAV
jgi:AcrR family transcriptional regulator